VARRIAQSEYLAKAQTRGKLFQRAVFVNLTNPKSIVFLAALFPQFIVPHQPQVMQYLVLGVTTIVVDIIVMIGYATLAQRIAAWIKGPKQMKALNKVFGSLFMLVGALLASVHAMPEAGLPSANRNPRLARNDQMNTEAGEQRTGNAVDPFRHPLVTTAHRR
jgi:hypothetical protein